MTLNFQSAFSRQEKCDQHENMLKYFEVTYATEVGY